ncbi:UTRA domain-containing protein [Paracoccus albus]|uniref:UTRA domain-containing protein n=1 Tax=Paracoccus albus TaxID=3017784 RepID=UPI0022F06AE3|nr:UTRA domain-containing protein [Paracoccus albus]WBU61256.1 GntR family transcriptional regulator [Paracoccus albus]
MPSVRPNETHHSRITEDMRRKIVDGEWPPGHQLTKETELAESYGVSRMTMNKALTQLTAEGFLIRRKRSGTFVAQSRAQSAVMEIGDIEREVTAQGLEYRWRLLSAVMRVPTKTVRNMLDMPPELDGRGFMLVEGLHFAQGVPFCHELRIIDPDIVPASIGQDFAAIVPGQWLLRSMPWTAASHRVRAVNARGADAQKLSIPSGRACLEVLRKTRMDHDWVTHVRLLYPGEAHQLIAEFAP